MITIGTGISSHPKGVTVEANMCSSDRAMLAIAAILLVACAFGFFLPQ